jgi:hypothetical protein
LRGRNNFWKGEVVKERFAGLRIALDEDAADRNIPYDASQSGLERCAGAEDRDTAEVSRGDVEVYPVDGDGSSASRDGFLDAGEEGEGVFDYEGGEAVCEEDEVFWGGGEVAEEGVDALSKEVW